MELTGQEIVRMLLELPPYIDANGKRQFVSKDGIRAFTGTSDWKNVDNWLNGTFSPKPEHLERLRQMLVIEQSKRENRSPVPVVRIA